MFASLNILAPTSAFVIVINAVLAKIYFDERLTFYGYLGSAMIMIGCSVSIVFGTHSQDDLKIDDLFIKADSYKFILFTTIHGFLCILFGIVGSIGFKMGTSSDYDKHHELTDIQHESEKIALFKSSSCSNHHSIFNADEHDDEDDRKLEELTPTETQPINPKAGKHSNITKNDESRHILRCFLLAFATAGLISWVQFLGKISADFLFESIVNGNDQFKSIQSWAVVIILCCLLVADLYLISEVMRIFDAVLIVPIYNSLQILSTIALSTVYFDNFSHFKRTRNLLLFSVGILLILSGIGAVSHGQKHQSMAHHAKDKRKFIDSGKAKNAMDLVNAL